MLKDFNKDPNHYSHFDHVIERIILNRGCPNITKISTTNIVQFIENELKTELGSVGYHKAKLKLSDAVTAGTLIVNKSNNGGIEYQVHRIEQCGLKKRSIIVEATNGEGKA
jgi:hypothetical protein